MAYNQMHQGSDHITLPFIADDEMIENLVVKNFKNKQK
jgi:hypothetical protein